MGRRNVGYVLAVIVGLLVTGRLTADEAEDRAIAAIEKLGGEVARADAKPGSPVTIVAGLPPETTDDLLKAISGFSSLTQLNLTQTAVTDAGLKELRHFKKLRLLTLTKTKVTDKGMNELALLPALSDLDLSGTAITDVGLREIAKIKTLMYLTLADTNITDTGLKEIAKLPVLYQLGLARTKVADAGIKELAPLEWLHFLNLAHTRVTDSGIKDLAVLKRITNLGLPATSVTDAGLKELAALKSLAYLGVGGPKITDAGLKELSKISTLEYLRLTNTQTTNVGINQFKLTLPHCLVQIVHEPPIKPVAVPDRPQLAKIANVSAVPSVFEVAPPPRLAPPKRPDELILGKWKEDSKKHIPRHPRADGSSIEFKSDGSITISFIDTVEIQLTGIFKLRDNLLVLTINNGDEEKEVNILVVNVLDHSTLTVTKDDKTSMTFNRIK